MKTNQCNVSCRATRVTTRRSLSCLLPVLLGISLPAGAQELCPEGRLLTINAGQLYAGQPGAHGADDQRNGSPGDGGGGGGGLGAWVGGGALVVKTGGILGGGNGGNGSGVIGWAPSFDGVGGRGGGREGGAGGRDAASAVDPNVRHGGNGSFPGSGGGGGHGAGQVTGGFLGGTTPTPPGNGGVGYFAGGGGGGGDNGLVPRGPGAGGSGYGRGGQGLGIFGGGGGGGPALLVTLGNATLSGGIVQGGAGGRGGMDGSGGFGAMVGGGAFTLEAGSVWAANSGGLTGDGGVGLWVFDGSATMQGGEIRGGHVGTVGGFGGGGSGVAVTGGSFTLSGGKLFGGIGGSDGASLAFQGTGLFVQDGTVELRGGEISGGLAPGSSLGGDALVIEGGTVRVLGGTFSRNPLGASTAAVRVRGGSLTVAGSNFQLNGNPLSVTSGTSYEVTPRSGTLTATLADSKSFAVNLANISAAGKLWLESTAAPSIPFTAALDRVGQAWTTGGASNWSGQAATTHDGVDAAQAGMIGHGQESWIESSFTGPGTLSFWWKVSSEAGSDVLRLHLDGIEQAGGISGETGWTQRALFVPPGPHVVRWRYTKNGATSAGADTGWLDQVSFLSSRDQFDLWASAAGLSGAAAAPAAIPHRDGIANLLKYAFNLNGSGPDRRLLRAGSGLAGLPVIAVQRNGASGILRVEFLRRTGSGLLYTPTKSATLESGSWVPLSAAPNVIAIDATWERVIYEEPFNHQTHPRLLARVEVTLQ